MNDKPPSKIYFNTELTNQLVLVSMSMIWLGEASDASDAPITRDSGLAGGAGIGIAMLLMVLIIRGSARADTTGLSGVVSAGANG